MQIEFPPGWGVGHQEVAIIVPYDQLDDFIETVRATGKNVYADLKNWARGRTNNYYFFDDMLHGSHFADCPGCTYYHLDDLLLPDADTSAILDFL